MQSFRLTSPQTVNGRLHHIDEEIVSVVASLLIGPGVVALQQTGGDASGWYEHYTLRQLVEDLVGKAVVGLLVADDGHPAVPQLDFEWSVMSVHTQRHL